MNNIYLDFETRSEVDIWKVGAWNYSVHPSTEILCMAICTAANAEIQILSKDQISDPEVYAIKFMVGVYEGFKFHAHYSMFENYIWHNILVKRYGWPAIPLRQWRCTAALAAAHALPRALDKAALALDLSEKKDMEGKRTMLKMCKPRKATKNNKAKWHEKEEDFQKLYDYCINDVEVERAIENKLPQLSAHELEVWRLDQIINTRGIYVDTEAVEAALYLIEKYTTECNDEIKKITDGYLEKVSQRTRVLNWIKGQGVELHSYTKDAIVEALKNNMPPQVKRVLEIRQQTGKTSTAKYEAIKNATTENSRVKDMFVYHGASTGRWAGKIVQLHNLPRGTIKDTETCIEAMKTRNLELFKFLYSNPMEAFSSCVRGMFIAAPGKDLLVADFASIEARVLAWVAGEEKALDYFRKKEDSYVKMAEHIFKTDKVSGNMRFVGKQAVLGCGYGMGAKRFRETCLSLGQKVSEELAKTAVDTFRKQNKKIVELWKKQEQAAIFTTHGNGGLSLGVPRIYWEKKKDFLYCTLPSGRKLAYQHPKIERVEKFGQTVDQLTFMGIGLNNQWIRQSTWGGTLVENIVQAISRDLLVDAMLRCEKAGYKVVLHVHDEVVAEISENCPHDMLGKFIEHIISLPKWAKGCPIEAEGWRGKRYRK